MDERRSWLCPTEFDEARLLDMSARVKRARRIAIASLGCGLLLEVGRLRWELFALFAVAALYLATHDARMRRSPRPERSAVATLLVMEALLAAAVGFDGGPRSTLVPLMIIPPAMAAIRFRIPVVWAGAAIAAAMMLAATVLVDPSYSILRQKTLGVSLILLVSVLAVTAALSDAERQHRTESVIDPLTGLLNRNALAQRFAELSLQARLSGGGVSLIVCDLDRFKLVNDQHGHDRGDVVLRDAAYLLRKQLRAFELAYRVGGEELLVVLPGVGAAEARAIAERLRETVEAGRPGGLRVTASFGVASASGERVAYDPLFAAADRALYRAKRAGRNRVAVAGEDEQEETPARVPAREPIVRAPAPAAPLDETPR